MSQQPSAPPSSAERTAPTGDVYEFGPFQLDPSRRTLSRNGEHVALTPKLVDTLLVLVQDAGHVVTKEELLSRVWPDTTVEEGSITNAVSALRKILNPDFAGDGPIATVARRGYRFVADVRLRGAEIQTAVLAPERSHHANPWRTAVLVAVTAALAAAAVFLIMRPRSVAFEHVRQTLLIGNRRDLGSTAVSPDGRFIAIIVHAGDREGLSLLNVATKSEVSLLPPGPLTMDGVRFSADGNFLYFLRDAAPDNDANYLFRIPILGGEAVRIADRANSAISFAPDHKTFAYMRWGLTKNSPAEVITVDPEGHERAIAKMPFWSAYLDWSPDGKTIVVAGPNGVGLQTVDVSTGDVRPLRGSPSLVRSPIWLRDGKGVLFRYGDPDERHEQIGFLSYPDGAFRRITTDANDYNSALTLTGDGQSVVTTIDRFTDVLSIEDFTAASPVETSVATGSDIEGMAWTEKGLLASVDGRLLRIAADGRSNVLIDESAGAVRRPNRCGSNGIVFRRETAGRLASLWRADADGTNRRPLTGEIDANYPLCSSDGTSVIYALNDGRLRDVDLRTGAARDLLQVPYQKCFAFSPDLKRLVYKLAVNESRPDQYVWRVVQPFERDRAARDFPVLDTRYFDFVRFTGDGSAFVYGVMREGADNLYRQPVDGSAGRFMTAFTDPDEIVDFALSPDGRSVALTRDHRSSDLVTIRQVAR